MSASGPYEQLSVQDGLELANTTGLPNIQPGTTPGAVDTAAGVSLAELQAWYRQKFNDEVAVSQDLMNTITVLNTSMPNQSVKTTLDNTLKVLNERAEDLVKSVSELETVAEQAAVPFVEEAPSVTGIPREHIFTLQDYILFIFILTYGIFALALLVLVGKRSGWSKSTLGKMLGGLLVVTIIGYVVIRRYA